MKKIIYLLLTIVLAITCSSYVSNGNIEKKVNKNDSTILVKVDVKTPKYQKGDENIYLKLTEALESYIKVNESKFTLLEGIMQEEPISQLEQRCEDVNISSEELFKKARADTTINFWTQIVCLFVLGWGIYIFNTKVKEVPWENLLLILLFFLVSIYLIQEYVYTILSYFFNKDYDSIKQIINLIK